MPFWHRCKPSQLSRIENGNRQILNYLEILLTKENNMAIDINQLTSDVNALKTTLTTGLQDLADEIAALKASNPGTDFTHWTPLLPA